MVASAVPTSFRRRVRQPLFRAARAVYLWVESGPAGPVIRLPWVERLKSRLVRMPASYVPQLQVELRAGGVDTWVAGGWGIDALAGHQTRTHYDVDLIIEDDPAVRDRVAVLLGRKGFRASPVESNPELAMPLRWEWHDDRGHVVEILPVRLDRPPFGGTPPCQPEEGAAPFGRGVIDGREVDCVSASLQRVLHRGYPQRPVDSQDLAVLDALTGAERNQLMTESTEQAPTSSRVPSFLRTAVGTASVAIRPSTALIIPVLDAEPAVGAWLGKASVSFDGAPLHVTTMFPFLRARRVGKAEEARIEALARRTEPFDFTLDHVGRFPGVVYLAPRPAEPFVELTRQVKQLWPGCEPYGGVYDSIVPHVTVAFGEPPADPSLLEQSLPLRTRATELWLLEQTVRGWRTRRVYRLGQ